MKPVATILLLCTILSHAQTVPYICQPTVQPQPLTAGDSAIIFTRVMTPCLGKSLSKTISVNHQLKIIQIGLCKWSGMLTAIQFYTDTFRLPPLQPGTYSITIAYTISSSDVLCQASSTQSATYLQTVSGLTALNELQIETLPVFPNPFSDRLFLNSIDKSGTEVVIYDLTGRELITCSYENTGVDTKDLPPGLYAVLVRRSGFGSLNRLVKAGQL